MYGNITQIVLPASEVWKPDLLIWNSLWEEFHNLYEVPVTVDHNGAVRWLPPGVIKTGCLINMYNFPFDTQICELRFGSWSHTKAKIDFEHDDPINNITGHGQMGKAILSDSYFYNNTEWEVVSTDGFLREQKYPCCPEALYQDFIFQIAVARYKKSPTVHLILPCALTSLLALMTFFVPPDAGEKIGLNVIVLLTMVVFMDQLNEQSAPMKDGVPILAQFFCIAMIIITLSMVATVVCLCLHHTYGEESFQMPPTMRKVFLEIIPGILKMKSLSLAARPEVDPLFVKKYIHRNAFPKYNIPKPEDETDVEYAKLLIGFIFSELRYIADRTREDKMEEQFREEWKYAAIVFDRVMAILFIVALLTSFSVSMAMALTESYDIGHTQFTTLNETSLNQTAQSNSQATFALTFIYLVTCL